MQPTLITLFELDLRHLTQESLIYRFIESKSHATPVIYDHHIYNPLPIESSGWELAGQGTLPRPRIKFANVNRAFSTDMILYDDLLGVTVTRLRLLVNQINTDNTVNVITDFRPDMYQIECKTIQNQLTN